MLIRSLKDFDDLEAHRVGNVDKLDTLFDVKRYLSNQSDIRTAIDRERGVAKAAEGYEQPLAALSPALRN